MRPEPQTKNPQIVLNYLESLKFVDCQLVLNFGRIHLQIYSHNKFRNSVPLVNFTNEFTKFYPRITVLFEQLLL